MQHVSKTQLKITGVELVDFELNPDLLPEDFGDPNNSWDYHLDTYREDSKETGNNVDELRVEVKLSYSTAAKKEIFSIQVDTSYETKHLKLADATEEFWVYITETAIRHCATLADYKTEGSVPDNLNFISFTILNREDTTQRIYEIWG
jgi:hypothetical protein